SVDELNSMYPDLSGTFKESLGDYTASLVARKIRTQRSYQLASQLGPQDIGTRTAGFLSALAPHAFDVINVGSGLLLGGALRGAGVISLANKSKALSTPVGRFAVGATEGFVGNIPGEFLAQQEASRYSDYSATEAVLN